MSGSGVPMDEGRLYFGQVMHQRLRPFRHKFRYRVFTLLIDLDRLTKPGRLTWLLSVNRFNLFSLLNRDHGPRDGTALKPWAALRFAEAGVPKAATRIHMLCFPRLLGYVFNPLSIYFGYDAQGRLRGILYEVKNTFGGQHVYVLPVAADHGARQPVVQACDKAFYVSPFIQMDARYRFRLKAPDERLTILIRQDIAEGAQLLATWSGDAAPLDDRRLIYACLAYPLMTFKVIVGIHWEALRLVLKGARYRNEATSFDEAGRSRPGDVAA
ncbi:MAG: DUF1365 domain-containing protein [Geminicoccaceae bacterium]